MSRFDAGDNGCDSAIDGTDRLPVAGSVRTRILKKPLQIRFGDGAMAALCCVSFAPRRIVCVEMKGPLRIAQPDRRSRWQTARRFGMSGGRRLLEVPAIAVGMKDIEGGDKSAGENVRRYIGSVGDSEANTRIGGLEGQHTTVKDHAVSSLGNLWDSGELQPRSPVGGARPASLVVCCIDCGEKQGAGGLGAGYRTCGVNSRDDAMNSRASGYQSWAVPADILSR